MGIVVTVAAARAVRVLLRMVVVVLSMFGDLFFVALGFGRRSYNPK